VTEFDSAAGRAVVQIALSNTSDAALWQGTRVSAIGFDVDADLAGASASGLFAQVVTGGKFPNQFGPVDVCAVDNPNNCSGGQNGGVTLGNSGVVALTLHFESGLPSLALGHFGVRYQSLDSKALGFCDASGTGSGTVPEPSLLGLLGAAGLALYGRRRSA
jgi:hypothetical protein